MCKCPKCDDYIQMGNAEELPKVICSLCGKLYVKQTDESWELVEDWDKEEKESKE